MPPQTTTAPLRPGIAINKARRTVRDNLMGITRPSIRRLARRGGVIRIKKEIYDEARDIIRERLSEILRNVILVLESSQTHKHDRKVVTTRDVVFALSRMGSTMYGFSEA